MYHDFNVDVTAAAVPNPAAPAASAASVRFRFTAQRQQRTASSNRAALERNWEVLQDPEPWIASIQDRAAVTASMCQMMEDVVTRRWVWPTAHFSTVLSKQAAPRYGSQQHRCSLSK